MNLGNGIFVSFRMFLFYIIELCGIMVFIFKWPLIKYSRVGMTLLVWCIYGVIVSLFVSPNFIYDIKCLLWGPIFYWLYFYLFSSKRFSQRSIRLLKKVFPILVIIQIALFVLIREIVFNQIDNDLQALNQIFYIAFLLPFLPLISNKVIKYLILLLIGITILLSFKRSVIISYTIVSFVFIYYDYLKQSTKIKFHYISVIVILCLSYFLFEYINEKFDGYLISRIEAVQNDKGSGRMDIYENTFRIYKEQSLTKQLFGIGFDGVRLKGWNAPPERYYSAHNDFLEILVDFGLMGLLLYCIVIIQLLRILRKVYHYLNGEYKQIMCSSLIVFFVQSSVSHIYLYPTYFCYLMIVWAYIDVSCLQKKMIYISQKD